MVKTTGKAIQLRLHGIQSGVPNETAPQENRSTVFNQSGWEIRKPGVELAGKIRNEINPLLGV